MIRLSSTPDLASPFCEGGVTRGHPGIPVRMTACPGPADVMSPNMKGRIRKWREERTARAWAHEEGLGMLTPKDARELDLEPQAPDPLPCPHCGKPLGRLGINVEGRVLWVSHELYG